MTDSRDAPPDAGRAIKVKAFAVIFADRSEGRLLVSEGHDAARGLTFHRLLGGHVEFGEHARDAVVREIREELGRTFRNPTLLGVLEVIFEYEREPGHEVVFVYSGELEGLTVEPENDITTILDEPATPVVWRDLTATDPQVPLFPEGLEQLLAGRRA